MRSSLCVSLSLGRFDGALARLYSRREDISVSRSRAIRITEKLVETFSAHPAQMKLFSAPGRTEIGGNHTDHQHGHVLCGSVDMDMLACASPNHQREIHILSEGYAPMTIILDNLEPMAGEHGTTSSLVRGVCAGILERGYDLQGFDACVTSNVLSGSGLSSSAAFEVLVGTILNDLCCDGKLDYFGKPCGLMDQMGASLGGAVAIDFADQTNPKLEQINYSFTESGHCLCIVDTGSDHADLTADYAAVTREMKSIAAYFGKQFLREVTESDFYSAIPALRQSCGDRAVLRAKHFFAEDRRAVQEARALNDGNFSRFLALVNASGFSSSCDLQNIWSPAHPEQQAVSLALSLGRDLLDGAGAIRVHGGGFAGTVQAFVPNDKVGHFKSGMESVFGFGKCHVLHIRPVGGCVISE